MKSQALYQKKLGTLSGALDLIRSNAVLAFGNYGNEPRKFLAHLHTIAPRVQNVKLWVALLMDKYPVVTDNSLQGKFDLITFFCNADSRNAYGCRRAAYVPMNLHSSGRNIVDALRPTVFVAAVSPMDLNGRVYLSFDLQNSLECIEAADIVIFEINKQIPRIGGETAISIEKADYIYETDYPLCLGPESRQTESSDKIGSYVATLIKDGDCIQLGIGDIPNSVGRALMDKHALGIHSEMLTATMGQLIRSGVVTNERKTINRGKTIGSFVLGDKALYGLLRDNATVELRRAAYVNDPMVIMQNDNMVSVNTALQVDLSGQICSESIGSTPFSGTGGASDFAYGAYHAKNGRGIIAMLSTAKNGSLSRISPQLLQGSVVSISRNIVDYVITEYGIARLRDKTLAQRADALISIAHPNFRAELRKEAEALMLL